MNTRISYFYRDASNYKAYNECIVRGLLTDEQTKAILDCLDRDNFIPSQVGLPERRFDRFDPEVEPGLAESHVNAHHYQFESRLYFKDAVFGLAVCSTAGHTQYPASSEESTEFDIAYASEDYLAQMNAIQSLAAEEKDFDLFLEVEAVGWDEADRETVFSSRFCSDNSSFSLQPTADMCDCIENIPITEFQNANAYAWGAFFSKVKELSPHDLDAYRRFAGQAAFHDGVAGREWLRKARNGELRSDLSDIIAKAQKTFEEVAKGAPQQPRKTPER